MRMLLHVSIPNEPFNSLVRAGKAGEILGKILEEIKPEAAYFSEEDGMRGGTFVIDVADASKIPSLAEPFFLSFNAECRFRIAMTPEDLASGGLDELGKRWAG